MPFKDKEKKKEWQKKYYRTYYQENKKCLCEYQEKYREENPEYAKQYRKTPEGKACYQRGSSKRRAIIRNIINTLTSEEWIDILKEYKFRCAYCGKEFNLFDRPERDHVIPLSKGGNNTKENIAPACRSCNARKYNKIGEMLWV